MISRFFIDRPIFASVLSIVITLAGGVAVFSLPMAQYPPIAPPTVQVTCTYPGANAQVVADTVAAPIEQQVNGVEGMLYMSSQCTNDGAYDLTVTFDLGTDLNTALVHGAEPRAAGHAAIARSVQQQGVNIKKKTPNILLVVNLFSPDGRYDDLYLSNYATIHVKDELVRLAGVGDIAISANATTASAPGSTRRRLATRNLTAGEVVNAVQNQNHRRWPPARLGQQPRRPARHFRLPSTPWAG